MKTVRLFNPFGNYPVCKPKLLTRTCETCGRNTDTYTGKACPGSSIWRRWSYVSIMDILLVVLAVLAIVALVLALHRLQVGGQVYGADYRIFFNPAFHAENPYEVRGFFSPFWTLWFMPIFELFGDYQVAVWITANICTMLYVYHRLKVPALAAIPLFMFSGAVWGAYVGNIEGFVALGLILPPPIGFLFLMMKPQIGMAVAAYFALDSLMYKGWKRTLRMFAPLILMLAISVLLYGAWFLNSSRVVGMDHNSISFFPYGVPVGIALIIAGVARRNIGYALMAIPLTTPYMIFHTWAFPILGAVLVLKVEWVCAMAWRKTRERYIPAGDVTW